MVCGAGWFSPLCGYNVTPFNIMLFFIFYVLFVAVFILGMWGLEDIENVKKELPKEEVIIIDRNKHNMHK